MATTNYKLKAKKETRTKAELLEAIDQLQVKVDAQPALTSAQTVQVESQKSAAFDAASASAEDIVQNIGTLNLAVNRELTNLQETLVSQADRLSNGGSGRER